MEYLTQEEVNSLPTGTKISVKWSGGNGPADYVIVQTDSGPYVEDSFTKEPNFKGGRLDFVGTRRMNTLVSLI